jgi:outer membrane protein OmpA-like peptidoglycan-associated protein
MKSPRSSRQDDGPWLSFTDLLSNSFIIICLVLAFSILSRAINEKPPIVPLPDSEKFRFPTGGYSLSMDFKSALVNEKVPLIRKYLRCYGVDTIEVVGHTDRQPNDGQSNLDFALANAKKSSLAQGLKAGSNVDLGFLRAMAVRNALESQLNAEFPDIIYRVYSAGSFIDPAVDQSTARATLDDKSRRRIEVRFTRTNDRSLKPAAECDQQL